MTMTGTATGSGTDVVDVRDGRGDDTVRRGAPRRVVIGDPGRPRHRAVRWAWSSRPAS